MDKAIQLPQFEQFTSLTAEKCRAIRDAYSDDDFDEVFPAGSAVVPALFVGRKAQLEKISSLVRGVQRGGGLLGAVIHGPRGTGKTALLSALRQAIGADDAMVIGMTGNGALRSDETLISRLSRFMSPLEETSSSHRGGTKLGVSYHYETSTTHKERIYERDIQSSIESVVDNFPGKPVFLLVDEAHGADPMVLGNLMNSVQAITTGGQGRIGFVLAGTPDTLDVLSDTRCRASWFLDRAQDERLIPVPNDLSVEDCEQAIQAILKAANVTVQGNDLRNMLARCKGSPYFFQVLGQSALASASRHGDIAVFEVGGEIDRRFEKVIGDRYRMMWRNLNDKNLSACARQMGCLWRRMEEVGDEMSYDLIRDALESGLKHPSSKKSVLSLDEAEIHFKHLGLLWSTSGDDEGPWSLGLPSFFDHVEHQFESSRQRALQATLPKLQADMETLFDQVGWRRSGTGKSDLAR